MNLSMSMGYAAGLLVGILIAAVLIKLFFKKFHTDGKKDRYDERQQMLIGKGYKYGFYGILIYNGLYAVLGSWLNSSLFSPGVSAFINVSVGLIVFAAYCVWNGAYFAMNFNAKRYMILLIVIAVINYIVGFLSIARGVPMVENGVLTISASNLMCAGLMTAILLIVLIRRLVPIKDDEE